MVGSCGLENNLISSLQRIRLETRDTVGVLVVKGGWGVSWLPFRDGAGGGGSYHVTWCLLPVE